MGFLNKNAVAARQLPVLAHQRIFAVSADLPGIMDTAQIGGYRITPAVSPRLPIGKRPPGRLYRRSSKWEGIGLHRLCPRVCPSANARLGGCIATAQNGTTGLPVRWIKPVIFSREAPGAWFPSFLKADSAGFHTGMPRLPSPPDKASATGGQHHGNGIPLL